MRLHALLDLAHREYLDATVSISYDAEYRCVSGLNTTTPVKKLRQMSKRNAAFVSVRKVIPAGAAQQRHRTPMSRKELVCVKQTKASCATHT